MGRQDWVPPEQWFASLPSVCVASNVVLTDRDDNVLLVKQNYRDHWAIPGGVADEGEGPHECAVREIAEEVGLRVTLDALLVVQWIPANGEQLRPFLAFVWDGGRVEDGASIRLQEEELDDARFYPWDEAAKLLSPLLAPRIPAAREARERGRTVYLPGAGRT
ncbi:NUDIX domain-containing protein [Actinomadura rugatobispora]|uniref:NUDIX domain-containing protein n=1 Tax=Actinomadura rugatobispora TaxID=1994 RepID=A0ABW1AAP4_9ACTN